MRLSRQSGVTLIELMIVVAIIGVLVAVAVPLLLGTTRKAKAAEIPAVFGEMKIRQQGYYNENGSFLSTGTDETDRHPALPPAGPDTPKSIAPIPNTWKSLRIQMDKTALYCSYVAIAGDAADPSNLGTDANTFGMSTAPEIDWFYLLADCDFDSDAAVSKYFSNSESDQIAVRNEGR